MESPHDVYSTDVLVIGGGLAGCWAAIAATRQGNRALVVDKGFVGGSGCSVFAGGVVLYLTPEDDPSDFVREHCRESELLLDPAWVEWLVQANYERIAELDSWGAPFDRHDDESGGQVGSLHRRLIYVGSRETVWRLGLDSVELMKLMRKQVLRTKQAKLLDHTTIVKLLVQNGRIVGAVGIRRQDDRLCLIQAKAVVLAAGGCAWKGTHFGHDMLCGEAYALAWDVGAALMNMEFANGYIATNTRFDSHGQCILAAIGGRYLNGEGEPFLGKYSDKVPPAIHVIARGMAAEIREGRGPIQLDLSAVPETDRTMWLHAFKHIAELARRSGQDLFAERTQWHPGFNGSVSGSAGIHICDTTMASTVPGLYVAGDAATRGHVVGASSGITFLNLAWANGSGYAAGEGAGVFARDVHPEEVDAALAEHALAEALQPMGRKDGILPDVVYGRLQSQAMPPTLNIFREGERMRQALADVQSIRQELVPRLFAPDFHELVKCYEAEATAFTTALMYEAALLRTESRGWHYREDYPQRNDSEWLRWIVAKPDADGEPVFSYSPVPRDRLADLGLLEAAAQTG
jgi:succinate dehydrogenase/fumarate reductase flavoprotein subunit